MTDDNTKEFPPGLSVNSPTLISLFTGAGGLDIGLEIAGFTTVAAVDFDKSCVDTLRLNKYARISIGDGRTFLEDARIFHADIAKVSGDLLKPPGAPNAWRPDIMAGGPPCQPFSSAGKQMGLDDPRGRLFEHFVRLAGELQPRYILFENVRGLVTAKGEDGHPGSALAMVRAEFERIGYGTTFAILNAADYGIPQRRTRLFMLAARRGDLPTMPQATHSKNGLGIPWVTLGQFLQQSRAPDVHDIIKPSAALYDKLKSVPDGSGLKSAGNVEHTRPGGHWGYKQGTFIADLRKPARTVTASASQDFIRYDVDGLRRLTWRECAGLQGFPDEWQFTGGRAARYKQVGNAVPIIFGQILGQAVCAVLGTDADITPKSADWPAEFSAAINYTQRENARNGECRAAHKARR
jgi:DNA (cytosine-5)-methyltransferase 1